MGIFQRLKIDRRRGWDILGWISGQSALRKRQQLHDFRSRPDRCPRDLFQVFPDIAGYRKLISAEFHTSYPTSPRENRTKALFSPIYSAKEYSKYKNTASISPVFDLGASFSVLFPDLEIAASGETLVEAMDMAQNALF